MLSKKLLFRFALFHEQADRVCLKYFIPDPFFSVKTILYRAGELLILQLIDIYVYKMLVSFFYL